MTRVAGGYIQDILEAMAAIESFVSGITFEEFESDLKTQYAVIRGFTIIGEAAKQVPETVRKRAPGVAWQWQECGTN